MLQTDIRDNCPHNSKDTLQGRGQRQLRDSHRFRARIGSILRFLVVSGIAESDPTYALRDALIRPIRVH